MRADPLIDRAGGGPAPRHRSPGDDVGNAGSGTRSGWRHVRRLGLGVAVLGAAAWTGLQVQPPPYPPIRRGSGETDTMPLPADLPAPVHRFMAALHGTRVPVVHTAVITGRGELRIAGITFPARWRFSHATGSAYHHAIELTAFGVGLTSVDEWYLDGHARLELPFGVSEGPAIDQGANLALWAEAVWMTSLWVTHPAVSWEAVDEESARLVVPFGDGHERFTVRFDPATGMLERLESMRFKAPDDTERTLWVNEVLEWGEVDGHPAPLVTEIAWGDESSPWAHLRTEELAHDVPLDAVFDAAGSQRGR